MYGTLALGVHFLSPPPSTQAALKTTTPFLLPTTVLPKVEEDADRPRCDSNLVYMPNDRQATFCSCPRFLFGQYLYFFFTIDLNFGLSRLVLQFLTTLQSLTGKYIQGFTGKSL